MPVIAPSKRGWAVLLSLLVLLSSAMVPLSGATNGTGQGDAFESFEVGFESAEPEKPATVDINWNLTEDATDVERVRIAFIGENNDTINLYKPADTDVPNPFTVGETDGGTGSADIVVDDLTAVSLQLKIPVGHCERIDEVQVFTSGEDEDVTEPDIRKGVSCGPDTDGGTFAVTIHEYDDNVTAGENASVTATIANAAETEATQDVRFLVDGEEVDVAENLTLSGNQSEELTFVYETGTDDVPEIVVAVESDDDAGERTVAVDEPDPAFFAVTIENASAAVAAGETVEVTVRVENTGDHAGTQNVSLASFDGKTVDTSEPLTLSADESTTVTLVWATESTDARTGNVTVRSENDTDTAAVTVDQPAVESINATLAETELETGEETSITVEATFTDGSTRDVTENATLAALETEVATVTVDGTVTAEGDGTTDIEAVFGNETDVDTITVEAVESSGSESDRRERSDGDGADVGDDGDKADDGDDGDDGDADRGPDDPDPTHEGDSDWPFDAPTDEVEDDGSVTDTGAVDESDGADPDDGESDTDEDQGEVDEEDAGADSADGAGETDETSASSIVVSPILGLVLLAPLLAKRRR